MFRGDDPERGCRPSPMLSVDSTIQSPFLDNGPDDLRFLVSDPDKVTSRFAKARLHQCRDFSSEITKAILIGGAVCVFLLIHCVCLPGNGNENENATTIIKSAHDAVNYSFVTLPNGLRALLASDPSTTISSAAMNMEVGSIADPKDTPGLAHFQEHMLFMASKKYPEEDGFMTFAKSHGGLANAFTTDTNTNYRILVSNKMLPQALDRFAHMFIDPILAESAVKREVHAINSEHEKNMQQDGRRQWQLLKELSNPEHCWHRFNTGSLETLDKPGILDKLKDFHQTYYKTASKMELAVIGSEPLDVLESMVVEKFANLSNEPPGPDPVTHGVPLFTQRGIKVHMEPVKDLKTLSFIWALPDFQDKYRNAVPQYLKYAFQHSSIERLLKEKGLITKFEASYDILKGMATLFSLDIHMTDKGLRQQDDIANVVFSLIDSISGQDCSLWEAMQESKQLAFRFPKRPNPEHFVRYKSQEVAFKQVPDLLGSWKHYTCDLKLIKETLQMMTPQNVIMMTIASMDSSMVWTGHKIEPIYGTQYYLSNISESLGKTWSNADPIDWEWPVNPYVPSIFNTFPPPKKIGNPILIKFGNGDTGPLIWTRKSEVAAETPVFSFDCSFQTKSVNPGNLTIHVALALMEDLLASTLHSKKQLAKQAGHTYSLTLRQNRVGLHFSGWTDTLPRVMDDVVDKLKETKTSMDLKKSFEVAREKIAQEVSNVKYKPLFRYIQGNLKHMLIYPTEAGVDEKVAEIKMLTFDQVQMIYNELLASNMHAVCLGYGNVLWQIVGVMATNVSSLLPNQGLDAKLLTSPDIYKLKLGQTTIKLDNPNPDDKNGAAMIMYQMHQSGSEQLKDALVIRLLAQLLSPRAFEVLRTQEQLGYVVKVHAETIRSNFYVVSKFYITIQSSSEAPNYLDERAAAFITEHKTWLQIGYNNDPAAFAAAKEGLLDALWPRATDINSERRPYWEEIKAHRNDFDFDVADKDRLEAITFQNLMDMYDRLLMDPTTTRRVSLLLYPQGTEKVTPADLATPNNKYHSIESWAQNRDIIKGSGDFGIE